MASLLLLAFVAVTAILQAGGNKCILRSSDRRIMVSCRGHQLTSVPPSVPDDVTWLDLSHNVLRNISDDTFRRFQRLQFLDLSHNAIKHLDTDAFLHHDKLEVLNLTHNNLTALTSHIRAGKLSGPVYTTGQNKVRGLTDAKPSPRMPRNSTLAAGGIPATSLKNLRVLHLDHNAIVSLNANNFIGLSSLSILTLSHNLLESVHNDSFQGLTQLGVLTLDANKLQSLEAGSFRGLSHLETLSLSHNQLLYTDEAIPPGVFSSVGHTLTSLSLEGNIDDLYDGGYPEASFKDLSALQTLKVDTMRRPTFGEGSAAMRQLTTLDLSHECRLRVVTNQTFLAFSNTTLQHLWLSECTHLVVLDVCAFCPLKLLTSLQLSFMDSRAMDVSTALRSVYGFQHRNNLSVIDLEDFSLLPRRGVSLDRHSMQFMANTCVRSLRLAGNYITSIQRDGLGRRGSRFCECIQHVDLSRNNIIFVNVFTTTQFLAFSPRLESVHCELQRVFTLEEAIYIVGNNKNAEYYQTLPDHVTFKVSPALLFLNFSGSGCVFGSLPDNFAIENADNLRTLDMSYIGLSQCTTKFQGLDHLEILSLSGNDCRIATDYFFDAFPRLRTLAIQKMNFDTSVFMAQGSRLFANLTHLEILDLSGNDLGRLPSDLLHAQSELRQLLLPGNRLGRLSLDVRHHGNLTLLDLSDNDIAQLNARERASLEAVVAKQPEPFHLRLHGNPLVCSCTTLSFVRWLRSTRIRLDYGGNYSCVTDSGQLSSTATVADNWQQVWRRCVGPSALWASVLLMLLLLSLTGLVWGLAANATRLQFLVRVFKRIKMPRRQQFLRDAYVAYCDADAEFVCLRLKRELQDRRGAHLLIKDLPRDETATQFWLLPGDNAAQKMLEHMDLCWKVVLVLTPALSSDPMVGFMTRAVLQTITDRMQDRVLLLCVGVSHVPALASLRALLDIVSEKQVFFLPARASRNHPAWDRMADVILN